MKTALITGITGQDGFFLLQLLIDKGYEVHGVVRRNSQQSLGSLELLDEKYLKNIKVHWGDITDEFFIMNLIKDNFYDEIYHLAAQSFVGLSFTNPSSTYDCNISGTLNIINSVRDFSPKSKMYFAATSELFGKIQNSIQNEETPFYPRSPYAISKLAGFWTMKNYRESYNLFLSNGILFNHESEVRGLEFVTRKITDAISKISVGKQDCLEIGNMYAKRDWGYAKDYVEGMWKILQHDTPDDFVLATSKNYSVKNFIEACFNFVDIDIVWEGEGINEIAKSVDSGKILVKVNPKFFRPAEVEVLLGDYSKAKEKLSWEPTTQFEDLVKIMMKYDLSNLKND